MLIILRRAGRHTRVCWHSHLTRMPNLQAVYYFTIVQTLSNELSPNTIFPPSTQLGTI